MVSFSTLQMSLQECLSFNCQLPTRLLRQQIHDFTDPRVLQKPLSIPDSKRDGPRFARGGPFGSCTASCPGLDKLFGIWCLLLRYLVIVVYRKCEPHPNIQRISKSKIKTILLDLVFFCARVISISFHPIDAWPFSHGSETFIRSVTMAPLSVGSTIS